MSGDRLSNLSDDLLLHILSFAPAKESASTSALARRWRSVWRSSGTLNLQWRSFMVHSFSDMRWIYQEEATAALNAQATPVRKLTLHVQGEEDPEMSRHSGMYYDMTWDSSREIIQAVGQVISSPAARQLEEIRIRFYDGYRFDLKIASLPTAALRVLHLANWMWIFSEAGDFQFPRLEELRLDGCSLVLANLHGLIHAAPLLTTLLLHTVDVNMHNFGSSPAPCGRLSCPKLTTLVLCDFDCLAAAQEEGLEEGLEFDAPMLRYFKYKGRVRRVSLKSPMACLAMADVHLDFSEDPHKDYINDQATTGNRS